MYSLPTYHNGLVTSEHKPKHWGYWCVSYPSISQLQANPTHYSPAFVHDNVDSIVLCEINATVALHSAVMPGCRSPRIIPSLATLPLESTNSTMVVP